MDFYVIVGLIVILVPLAFWLVSLFKTIKENNDLARELKQRPLIPGTLAYRYYDNHLYLDMLHKMQWGLYKEPEVLDECKKIFSEFPELELDKTPLFKAWYKNFADNHHAYTGNKTDDQYYDPNAKDWDYFDTGRKYDEDGDPIPFDDERYMDADTKEFLEWRMKQLFPPEKPTGR